MRLIATQPLFVPAADRGIAERALTALATCRFVTKTSLHAAFGPYGLRLDIIDAWVKAGVLYEQLLRLDPLKTDETRILALTRMGARSLESSTGLHVESMSPARLRAGSQKRAHDTWVGETALAMIALADKGDLELIGIETDDRKLAISVLLSEPGKLPERVSLRPDALVMSNGTHGRTALLIETDRGTVSLDTMTRRYRGYLAWKNEDGPHSCLGTRAVRILTIVSSAAREKSLYERALDANGGKRNGMMLFARQDDISVSVADRLLGPIARPLGAADTERVPAVSAPARNSSHAA
jgi:hypothetical protein